MYRIYKKINTKPVLTERKQVDMKVESKRDIYIYIYNHSHVAVAYTETVCFVIAMPSYYTEHILELIIHSRLQHL